MLLLITISSSCFSQKNVKLYGISYKTKIHKDYGDYGVWYVSEQYYYNNKNTFGITLKGLKNDSVVMVAKKRILKDRIIVTEVYNNVENIDSTVCTMYFKNGVYQKSTYKDYYNNKRLPNRPTINDLQKKN